MRMQRLYQSASSGRVIVEGLPKKLFFRYTKNSSNAFPAGFFGGHIHVK